MGEDGALRKKVNEEECFEGCGGELICSKMPEEDLISDTAASHSSSAARCHSKMSP